MNVPHILDKATAYDERQFKQNKQFSGDLLKNQARQSTQMEVWRGTLVMSLSAARGFRGWTSKVEGCASATN